MSEDGQKSVEDRGYENGPAVVWLEGAVYECRVWIFGLLGRRIDLVNINGAT